MPGPRILGQHAGTGVAADVYASPAAGAGSSVSTIALINTGSVPAGARVQVVPQGAAPATVHVLIPDAEKIVEGDLVAVTVGVTLGPGERIVARAEAGVNVHVYGIEL